MSDHNNTHMNPVDAIFDAVLDRIFESLEGSLDITFQKRES
jgi:hypothetical protein